MLDVSISIRYMVAGYALILTVLTIYIFSLFIRWRSLKRDLITLKEITKKK
jgi:hypothetical protein